MYCNKCGTKNENDSNYCINCGNKLENNNVIFNNSNNSINNDGVVEKTNLSIASLVCLGIKFLSVFVGFISSSKWFFELPWLLISLVLAIISRVKYKDKMSKILIIVDSILLVIEIILFIIVMIILTIFVSEMIEGCNGIG